MANFLDRVQLAFQRFFADIANGNFSDILMSDVGLVAVVAAVPLFVIGTLIGGSRN